MTEREQAWRVIGSAEGFIKILEWDPAFASIHPATRGALNLLRAEIKKLDALRAAEGGERE